MANVPQGSTRPDEGEDVEDRVIFDYIKSQAFRSVHADGLIGGITPNGHLHFALYCERTALPQRHVHSLTDEGMLADRIEDLTVSRAGIVREMEIDAFVTLDAAKRIRDWFVARVEELESRNELIAELVEQKK